jgi:hypothetical protein
MKGGDVIARTSRALGHAPPTPAEKIEKLCGAFGSAAPVPIDRAAVRREVC